MSLPPKPWEATTSTMTSTATTAQKETPGAPAPPPVPGYSDDMNAYGSYGGNFGAYQSNPFMSRYGGMGYPSTYGSPYGGYGSYGSYGSYGGMFGGFGGAAGDTDISRFVDDNTRSAFQSVEHIVHAFSSVSMMLESTYFALYNSFRAVLGVGDHLSRVSEQLSQLMNSMSLIRTIRWIIRRTLQVLGIVKVDAAENVWNSASQLSQNETNLTANTNNSSWPVLAFFSVVMGAPYLIYKVFGLNSRENAKWASGESPHYTAVALYDFIGRSDKELSFTAGAKIRLAPKNLQSKVQGWLIGSVDGKRIGLIPYNYLKIFGPSESTTALPTAKPPVQALPSCSKESLPENDPSKSPTNARNDFVNISMSELSE